MKQYKETLKYLELVEKYNKLAKAADRKMRNLEKLSQEPGFENVLKYAYKRAEKDISSWTPPGEKERKPRWQRNIPYDTRSLKAKIKDIETFMHSPTRGKRGIIRVYKNRVDAINKKYGTNFTWQQFSEFFDTGLRDKSEKYGSATVLISMGVIQANKNKVLKSFEEHEPVHLKVEDEKTQQTIDKLLRYHEESLSKILN